MQGIRSALLTLGSIAAMFAACLAVALVFRPGTRAEPNAVDPRSPTSTDQPHPPSAEPGRPAAERPYSCVQPDVQVEMREGCERGAPYPACAWRLPDRELDGSYELWRNTTPDHRWARPGLVSLLLAVAREWHRRWPDEPFVIGDLDAPGPRHQTHDRGVDVDMYLPASMIAQNLGGRRYPDNYEGKPPEVVAEMRAKVLELAKILATCARGRLRIYYNDQVVVDALRAWFASEGLSSDVGLPMMQHNALHRFHFHMTIADDLPPLPKEGTVE